MKELTEIELTEILGGTAPYPDTDLPDDEIPPQ